MSLRIGKFPDNKGGSCLQDIVIEVNKILEGGTGGGGGSVNIPDEIITDISVDPNSTNTTQVGLEIIKDKSGVEETTQIYIESASDTKAGVMSSDDKIELGELRTDLTQTQTDLDNVELSVDELQDDVEALENKMTTVESTLTEVENSTLNYDSATKKIQLLQGGDVVSEIDAARFVKDGIVDSVMLNQDTKSVTITFNVDAGKEDITVDFSDIYDVLLTEAKDYTDGKVGANEYTNANYISKETNLTDAALQLDEEIKATNDNLAILNAATIKGVKVGIIDSGIEASHDVFKDSDVIKGGVVIEYENNKVVLKDYKGFDQYGHGTACAGIIHSIAKDAELYSIQVLGNKLSGKVDVFLKGLEWAIENDMDVINLSLGTTNQTYDTWLKRRRSRKSYY